MYANVREVMEVLNLVILTKSIGCTNNQASAPRLYEHAVSAVCAHRLRYTRNLVMHPYIGWIHAIDSPLTPYPPAFESRGLSLSHVLFVESRSPTRTFHALTQEESISIIVIDARLNPALIQLGRRWLKSETQPEVLKATELGAFESSRLLVLFDSHHSITQLSRRQRCLAEVSA